jgi:hypothetical protein
VSNVLTTLHRNESSGSRDGTRCGRDMKILAAGVSRGSSVSTVSGYRLDDRAIEVRSPAEAKGLFL